MKTNIRKIALPNVTHLCFLVLIGLMACKGEKILVANFEGNNIGQSPSVNQSIGTVRIDGPTENCTVEKINNSPGKWIKISRINNPQIVDGLQGIATSSKGMGKYLFNTTLYIPDNGGVATIQFEPHNQPTQTYTNFLHIDFLENNSVKVNDNNDLIFGTFPRNQPFIVQVELTINSTGASAHIILSGANTAGEIDLPDLRPVALIRQFGTIRFWMGLPWVGSFYATNIVLRYQDSDTN